MLATLWYWKNHDFYQMHLCFHAQLLKTNLKKSVTAAAAIKRQIPLCCCLNACYMCIRNGFIPSSCWVGRQAREAATCAFIIYKRMNIKDYDGKPSRILDNSRFVLNFFIRTYLGVKYLVRVFVFSRSLKTRERSFAQFVYFLRKPDIFHPNLHN